MPFAVSMVSRRAICPRSSPGIAASSRRLHAAMPMWPCNLPARAAKRSKHELSNKCESIRSNATQRPPQNEDEDSLRHSQTAVRSSTRHQASSANYHETRLGLHRDRISRDKLSFARQAGCTHLVSPVDRFRGAPAAPGRRLLALARTGPKAVYGPKTNCRRLRYGPRRGRKSRPWRNRSLILCDILLDGRANTSKSSAQGASAKHGRLSIPISATTSRRRL